MVVRPYPFGPAEQLLLHPAYLRLQAEEPVSRIVLPYGGEAWLVTKYDDVRTVLADPRFSRAATMDAGRELPRTISYRPQRPSVLTMDPPAHTRLRRLVANAFTARRAELSRDRVQEIADGLLDRLAEHGPPVDLVEALALPLPIATICELLGVPFGDRGRFRKWSDAILSLSACTTEEIQSANLSLRTYIAGLVERKRAEPADDLLTELISARDQEDRLTEEELVSFGVTLLVAGYETTAGHIGNFVWTLLRNPDRLAELHAEPSLVKPAVEELLRTTPTSAEVAFPRVAMADVELRGVLIATGDTVFVANPAANRDPEVFPRPDETDFRRETNPHLAFGYGAHHCVGAALARMELQVVLGSLLGRFPGLRLAGDVEFRKGRLIRGPQSLPVQW
ncbi:cytochrome P450 [Amycolatopsis sp. NPDC054798]